MASFTSPICSKSPFHPLPNSINSKAAFCNVVPGRNNFAIFTTHDSYKRLSYIDQPRGNDHRSCLKPINAVASAKEKTLEESVEKALSIGRTEIVVESQENDKMKLRVDLTGEQTQKAFTVLLSSLYRAAPPTTGLIRRRNGRISKVPKNVFMKMLGKENILKYTMKQVITLSVAKYLKKTNPDVKGFQIIGLTQSVEELTESFLPGNPFGFNVEFELLDE